MPAGAIFAKPECDRTARHLRHRLTALLAGVGLAALCAHAAGAVDAMWEGGASQPATGNWNNATNWSGNAVPDGTASFGTATTTTVTLSNPTAVGAATFNPGASAYTFNFSGSSFSFLGTGIANNSGTTQTYNIDGAPLEFHNNATIANSGTGSSVVLNTLFSAGVVGQVLFFDTASAGSATINNKTSVEFHDGSNAGSADITNGGIPLKSSGTTTFFDQSSAGNAHITNTSVSGVIGFTNFGNFALGGTDTATAGNATIDNINGGFTSFYGNTTGGNATITTDGSSGVGFFEKSTAGSAHIDNVGFTTFGNSGGTDTASAGSAVINNNNGGSTQFFANTTAGSATINNNGGGLTSFSDNSTAGNATITTNAGGSVLFTVHSTGGQAQFVTNAGGVVDFSGTTGPVGNRRITAGSIAGAGLYNLGSNQLTVGGNNLSTAVSGVIADCFNCSNPGATGGSLVKVGTGTLTLSGVNTYTGATTVNDGTLIVGPGGSVLASSGVFVNAGGVLGGTGGLPSVTVTGGTLSPGNSIGTMTITGSLVMSTAATYLVEVSPTTADRTNVATTASVAGTIKFVPQAGAYTAGQQYVVINAAGGVSGTFGTVTTSGSFGANVVPRVTYDANDVFLVLDPASVALSSLLLLQTAGLTSNQNGVAGALNAGFAGNALPADFLALFNLPAGSLPGTLSQLSGELVTAAAPAGLEAMNRFLMLMIDPFAGVGEPAGAAGMRAIGFAAEPAVQPGNVLAYGPMATKAAPAVAPFEQHWSAWAAAYGSQSKAGGDAVTGSHDRDVRTGNIASGFDYRFSPDTTVGVAFSGGAATFGLSDGLGSGRGDVYQAGAYGATRFNGFYLAASAAGSWFDMSESRTVALPGAIGTLQGDAHAQGWGARIEAGRRYDGAGFGVTPYAALQTQAFRTPAFSEVTTSGSAAFALSYAAQTTTRTRTELGLGADHRIADVGGALTLFGRAAWGHEFSPDSSILPAFAVLPGTPFGIQGAQAAPNSALLSAGALWANGKGVSLRLKAEGEFASSVTTYAGTATLRYAW